MCIRDRYLGYFHFKILTITGHTGSSKLTEAALSLLPSLVLGVIVYFGRKWLKLFQDQISEDKDTSFDKKIA